MDDNATNRHILTLQTARWGMLPRAASSGQQALAWLDAGEAFDAAVLDVQMPGMDGYMLTAQLRRRFSAVQLPVLVLTSLGDDGGQLAGLGVAQTLTKPTKAQVLFDAVSGLFERPAAAAAQPPAPSAGAAAKAPRLAEQVPLRVLLAEDNEVNQLVAQAHLAALGCTVVTAANGHEALGLWRVGRFDIVLMDCHMPVLDGYEASLALREVERLCGARPVPILALTANALEGARERCLAAGMSDHLAKPFTRAQMAQALRRWTRVDPVNTQEPSERGA